MGGQDLATHARVRIQRVETGPDKGVAAKQEDGGEGQQEEARNDGGDLALGVLREGPDKQHPGRKKRSGQPHPRLGQDETHCRKRETRKRPRQGGDAARQARTRLLLPTPEKQGEGEDRQDAEHRRTAVEAEEATRQPVPNSDLEARDERKKRDQGIGAAGPNNRLKGGQSAVAAEALKRTEAENTGQSTQFDHFEEGLTAVDGDCPGADPGPGPDRMRATRCPGRQGPGGHSQREAKQDHHRQGRHQIVQAGSQRRR